MSQEEYRAYLGLDWADEAHQGSLQEVGSIEVERFTVEQKPEAIQEWVGRLRARFGTGRIAVAVEQKRGALIYSLMKYEVFVIFPLNTTAVKNYRKALRASGAKDDVSDADIQLEFLKKHIDRLRKWEPESVTTRQLRFLVESRRNQVDEATAVSNRMHSFAKRFLPGSLADGWATEDGFGVRFSEEMAQLAGAAARPRSRRPAGITSCSPGRLARARR